MASRRCRASGGIPRARPLRHALVTLCLSAADALGFTSRLVARLPKPASACRGRARDPPASSPTAGSTASRSCRFPDRLAVEERMTGKPLPIVELPLGEPYPDLAAMYRAMLPPPSDHQRVERIFSGATTICSPFRPAGPPSAGKRSPPFCGPRQRRLRPSSSTHATQAGTGVGGGSSRLLRPGGRSRSRAKPERAAVFSRLPDPPGCRLDDFSARRLTIEARHEQIPGPVDLRLLNDGDPDTGWVKRPAPARRRGGHKSTSGGHAAGVDGVNAGARAIRPRLFPRVPPRDRHVRLSGVDWKTALDGWRPLHPRESAGRRLRPREGADAIPAGGRSRPLCFDSARPGRNPPRLMGVSRNLPCTAASADRLPSALSPLPF